MDLIVVHCTELPDLACARKYGERVIYPDSETGNSGHFYIERDGAVEQWVPLDRVAHHCRGFNHRSIGIELVNRGRFPNWLDSRHQSMSEPYTAEQMNSLLGLIDFLCRDLPTLSYICGHEQLDREKVPATNDPALLVFRKRDPGPMFPWTQLLPLLELTWFEP
jgi:N-acetylmuramoyl-L-alanine amidase